MDAYFLDSSGAAKRYIHETGSVWLLKIVDPAAPHEIHIARITIVEVVAAVARRQRAGSINVADAAIALADFDTDVALQYRLVEMSATLLQSARILAETHALRGYDAVQLATALAVNTERISLRLPKLTLISADLELNAAAQLEGLTVDNPNAHP